MEFLQLTGILADVVSYEKIELVEGLLDERQMIMERADELKAQLDILYLVHRGQLSTQGLAMFNNGKDEIAGVWREARDRNNMVANAMQTLLSELREKVGETQRGKRGFKAYTDSEMMILAKNRTE